MPQPNFYSHALSCLPPGSPHTLTPPPPPPLPSPPLPLICWRIGHLGVEVVQLPTIQSGPFMDKGIAHVPSGGYAPAFSHLCLRHTLAACASRWAGGVDRALSASICSTPCCAHLLLATGHARLRQGGGPSPQAIACHKQHRQLRDGLASSTRAFAHCAQLDCCLWREPTAQKISVCLTGLRVRARCSILLSTPRRQLPWPLFITGSDMAGLSLAVTSVHVLYLFVSFILGVRGEVLFWR
ncbi:unnamed protein product [Discosporangium mesarthrocarpum]